MSDDINTVRYSHPTIISSLQHSLLFAFLILSFLFVGCAGSLHSQVNRLHDQGRYQEALPLAQKSVELSEKIWGVESITYAHELGNLARVYGQLGLELFALPLELTALKIKERIYGPDHPKITTRLHNLSQTYQHLDDHENALYFARRAFKISEKSFGHNHEKFQDSLIRVASIYLDMGKFKKSLSCYEEALKICNKIYGEKHIKIAWVLHQIAWINLQLGNYSIGQKLAKQALDMKIDVLRADHPQMALGYYLLGHAFCVAGDYVSAIRFHKKELALKQKSFGINSPHVASSMNNLAMAYEAIGDYNTALSLFLKSINIAEKILGPYHSSVSRYLNNIGCLYLRMHKYSDAVHAFQRSLDIKNKIHAARVFVTAITMKNLGIAHRRSGNYDKALELGNDSLEIITQTAGDKNPIFASCLDLIATAYKGKGKYDDALTFARKSLLIKEKALNPNHSNICTSLSVLGDIYAAKGDHHESFRQLLRGARILNRNAKSILPAVSSAQRIAYLRKEQEEFSKLMSLVSKHLALDPSALKETLDIWLVRKGMSLETEARFQRALFSSSDAMAMDVFSRLQAARVRLAELTFSTPQNDFEEHKKQLENLSSHKDELEAQLAKISKSFAEKMEKSGVDTQAVAQALPRGSVLVEFVLSDTYDFKTSDIKLQWQPKQYFAFVLHAGQPDRVRLVKLGEAEVIDKAISNLKASVVDTSDLPGAGSNVFCRQLYKLVFEPIVKTLKGVDRVFLSPDGNLNLIPFEVLIDNDGRFLIEDYHLGYLNSGRDVTSINFEGSSKKITNALLLGDPVFDLEFDDVPTDESVHRGPDELRGVRFRSLPNTAEEVQLLAGIMGPNRSRKLLRHDAAERVFFAATRGMKPSVLHLATHGFFLNDNQLESILGTDSLQVMETDSPYQTSSAIRPDFSNLGLYQDPLLRSGLALSGANHALDGRGGPGIVTAEEVLGLPLHNTQIVVLSACKTGLGEVRAGEGVFGLRRTFVQAGAESLVMSMWSIPDRETKELMISFYKNLLTGMARNEALRQAALAEMKIARERYGGPNPLFWGAFVFLGQP